LIASHSLRIDIVKSQIHILLNMSHMLPQVCRDEDPPAKCSGRTSLAIAAKSSGLRISALGNAIPPFGHSRTACSIAPSCVPAYETCNWMIFFERVRILPRLLGAPGKPAQQHRDLLIRRADRDDTIGETAHALRHDRPGRCDIDRRRGSW